MRRVQDVGVVQRSGGRHEFIQRQIFPAIIRFPIRRHAVAGKQIRTGTDFQRAVGDDSTKIISRVQSHRAEFFAEIRQLEVQRPFVLRDARDVLLGTGLGEWIFDPNRIRHDLEPPVARLQAIEKIRAAAGIGDDR